MLSARTNQERTTAYRKDWILANQEEYIAYHAAYREANKERFKEFASNRSPELVKKYNANRRAKMRLDPEAEAVKQKANYLKHRENRIDAMRRYAIEKPEIVENIKASRRVRHCAAAIPWHKELTDFVVAEAANLRRLRKIATGISWNTDHIIPLKGRLVSGFHVYNNLAVIPEYMNRVKKNKHNPDKEVVCWSF